MVKRIRVMSQGGDISIVRVGNGIKIGLKNVTRQERKKVSAFLSKVKAYQIKGRKAGAEITKEPRKILDTSIQEVFVPGGPELITDVLAVLRKTKVLYSSSKKDVVIATPRIKHGC